MTTTATNRQIKVLRFYGMPSPETLSAADAHFEITDLWASPELQHRWDQYVYLTGDLDDDTAELRPFDETELERVQIPEDWDRHTAVRSFREAVAAEVLETDDGSPFNNPPPTVVVEGSTFVFTGGFATGSREAVERETMNCGGDVLPKIHPSVDYLVIGSKGSHSWKHGSYGSKIEDAILSRRTSRRPAIISETHWRSFLNVASREERDDELSRDAGEKVAKRKRRDPLVQFEAGFAVGFKMAVSEAFREALDIRFTKKTVKGVKKTMYTEGAPPCYGFSQGDTVYDTPLASTMVWGEALQHIGIAAMVLEGFPDMPTGVTSKSDGEVKVCFYRPTGAKDRLEVVRTCTLSQTAFVEFLRTGETPMGGSTPRESM